MEREIFEEKSVRKLGASGSPCPSVESLGTHQSGGLTKGAGHQGSLSDCMVLAHGLSGAET